MATSRGYLKGSFGLDLTYDVTYLNTGTSHINAIGYIFAFAGHNTVDRAGAIQMHIYVVEPFDGNEFDSRDNLGLEQVASRDEKAVESVLAPTDEFADNAADRAYGAVEAEFANEDFVLVVVHRNVAGCREDGDGNWQVEATAVFWYVSRRQIDADAFARHNQSGIAECAADALLGLVNVSGRSADNNNVGQTV
jgi:hypothetical protein